MPKRFVSEKILLRSVHVVCGVWIIRVRLEMFLVPYTPCKAIWNEGCVNEKHAASKADNVEVEEPVDDQAHTN
eukprot:2755636-Karenia_brevis.AAC.1